MGGDSNVPAFFNDKAFEVAELYNFHLYLRILLMKSQ